MKMQMRLNEQATIEAEGSTHQELFEQVARLSELFGQDRCGHCGKNRVRFVMRLAKGFKFFEAHCLDCRHRLAYGQPKEPHGSLFPKTRDENGNPLAFGGWLPPYQEHEDAAPAAAPSQAKPAPTDGGHNATINKQQMEELAGLIEAQNVDWKIFSDNFRIQRLSQLPVMHFAAAAAACRTRMRNTKKAAV